MKRESLHRSFALPFCLVTLTSVIIFAGPLAAQDGPKFNVSVGGGYRTDAEIDDGGGDFNETRFSVSAARPVSLNDKFRVDPMLSYRFSAYDFSRVEPWDDIHQLRGTLIGRYTVDDKWSVFAGPSVGFAGESDADAGDSITVGGALGASYRVNERFTIGGGATISTEIEDDARVRPILVLDWQINDRWHLESGYTDVAGGAGPGGELRYKACEQWTVGAGVQFQEKRFRLSDDGRVRDGVGEDTSIPLFAKVAWQPCANAAFELIGGVSVGGELRLENSRGHKISEEDYDPSALFGLRAVLTF
jgi:hypothetical protein